MSPERRERLSDILGLGLILLVLVDYLRPSLLLLPTIVAGGDTPCHYPTAVFFKDYLLPRFRLHGWYAGAYLGQPLLLYYFPLPFLVMAALAPLVGMPAAFKLGSALGACLLPYLAYAGFRLMGFRFPGPLLGASAALVFLFLEENPIWGGTLASTLTGEFSYSYGIGLAVLFMGVLYRVYSRGGGPWKPALALAVTALAHGYAVLWAGLTASYFLYSARRPRRTLAWLLSVGALAFGLAGFFLLPLLTSWGWTTPYDDPWITATVQNLVPRLLWPLLGFGGLGLAATFAFRRATGGADQRLLYLGHATLAGAALAAAGPALGIIDVRFVPFAQLAGCLLGAASLGLALRPLLAKELVALAFVLLSIVYAERQSQVLRYWLEWNYTGLEAKELWPAFKELTERLKGSPGEPRVAVEYSQEHEKAGSIRMYEMLPYFTGRGTLEGVYNQASVMTHPVYFLASELGASSPNPFRSREYSRFDTDNAIRHLRLLNVSDVVALSPKLISALAVRDDVVERFRVPPYAVFRLKDAGPGYVEPLAFAPVRSAPRGWRDKAYRWFTRKPQTPVPLVFTDDERFAVVEADEYLAPPAHPLEPGVKVEETMEPEALSIRTSRVGHPLLVKISYHPRWKAVGADGPYLVSPGLMLVVPRQPSVRLSYARHWSDALGWLLTAGAVALCLFAPRRRSAPAPTAAAVALEACALPHPQRRWGGLLPAALVLALVLARFASGRPDTSREASDLYEKASRAYSDERYPEAAEYARSAITHGAAQELRAELLCLRAESLLRAGQPHEAAEAFDRVIQEEASSPYVPQALFGSAAAHRALGEATEATASRERLLREFGETPWAQRAESEMSP